MNAILLARLTSVVESLATVVAAHEARFPRLGEGETLTASGAHDGSCRCGCGAPLNREGVGYAAEVAELTEQVQ